MELTQRVGRNVELKLKRCEVDIESFVASQRPMLKPVTDRMTEKAKKKALDEIKRWEKREKELKDWLDKARSWQSFVDFWAVDWDYGRHLGEDEKPIFITEWQSFRSQGAGDDFAEGGIGGARGEVLPVPTVVRTTAGGAGR